MTTQEICSGDAADTSRSEYYKDYYSRNKVTIKAKRKRKYQNDPAHRMRIKAANMVAADKKRQQRLEAKASGISSHKHYDDKGNQLFTIKELSAMTKKAIFTLRSYHDSGVLPETVRSPQGWRLYTAAQVQWIKHLLRICTSFDRNYTDLKAFTSRIHEVWDKPYITTDKE